MRQPVQARAVDHGDAPPRHLDDPLLLQAAEGAAHGLDRKTQVIGDVLAAHRQLEHVARLADVRVALAEAVQEQRHAAVRIAPHQHAEVVVVAPHALADHAHELLLQAGHARGHVRELVERHLADVGRGQRDRLAAMALRAERVQTDQLARQVEAEDLLLAFLG